MALVAGSRLGPYEIVAPLGAGGMGEVYRARDSRLGREVAVKVLPPHLSGDPALRARFEREARTVSQLNHANICVLHDIGRHEGVDYLVMELVEGETLAQRLEKGALPMAEVLRIGAQIAEALDRAHRAGVVHRDLKPGNIMLARGVAKLMDFGLARAGALSPAPGDLTTSPTVAQPLTTEGAIVGTFQYMAPEQLEAREADVRSDLWALGCVLYEMATGRRAFEGKSQASLISSIMKDEPAPLAELVPVAPPGLDRVIRTCLAKDPDERVQTAHDVKLQIDWLRDAGSSAGAPAPALPARRGRARTLVLALAGVALLALGVVGGRLLGPHAPPPALARLVVESPAGFAASSDPVQNAISPDGSTVVFSAADSSGMFRLWIRPLDSLTPRMVPGVENPMLFFWSPDSRMIGYWTGAQFYKVGVTGGAPERICAAPDARGAAWGSRGDIVFAPAATGPLMRVPQNGGDAVAATRVDSARGETAHRFPCFLPDGRHFLYAVLPAKNGLFPIRVGSVDSPESRLLFDARSAAVYVDPGFLIYSRGFSTVAQRFDPRSMKLAGEPVVLAEAPYQSNFDSAPRATSSSTGILAQCEAGLPNTELRWLDRAGRELGVVPVPEGRWEGLSLSDDGALLAIERRMSAEAVDIWTLDLRQPNPTRFTYGPTANTTPHWSPDGSRIAYNSNRNGTADLFLRDVDAADEKRVTRVGGTFMNPSGWTPDGKSILYFQPTTGTAWDIWMAPVDGDGSVSPVLRSPFGEWSGRVSPDGRWILYYSDESGRPEAYVQAFPGGGHKVQVSHGGASGLLSFGKWVRGGRELFFLGPDDRTLMACAVEPGVEFRAGVPRRLFRLPLDLVGVDVAADGERILVSAPAAGPSSKAVTLVMNWPALFDKPR